MSVNEKMTAIADAIRGKTGGTAALTLDGMAAAVAALEIGGETGGLVYDMGVFTLDADHAGTNRTIPHSLGERPEFILVWTDDYAGVTNPDSTSFTMLGFVWLDGFMGLDNWYTSAVSGEGRGTHVNFLQSKGATGMVVTKPTSPAYTFTPEGSTTTEFSLVKGGSATYYRAGATYYYFVSKAWWNVGGAASAE